jgi:hypothetical protein
VSSGAAAATQAMDKAVTFFSGKAILKS